MCGFRDARGDVIVTMDDDLQNPPEEVPKLLAALRNSRARCRLRAIPDEEASSLAERRVLADQRLLPSRLWK